MQQQQHNLEPPNEQLKHIVKQILSQKDAFEDLQNDTDKNTQGRTQRVSSYSFQRQQQPSSLLQKNRKKNNSIDQAQNGSSSYGNGNIKTTKTTSIPLSQLIQNIEQQNQINSNNLDSAYLLTENISLTQDQQEQISNCLKSLVLHLRSAKKQKQEKEQLPSSSSEQCIELYKLLECLKQQKFKSIDVVETLTKYSNFKQTNNQISQLTSENYKQLTLMCIQSNLKEWADFLLHDMQNNQIQPDRYLLDEYMKIAAK